MLHCSIYKVQFVSLSRVPNQFTTLFFVCQELFSFFSNFFRGLFIQLFAAFEPWLSRSDLISISCRFHFVKYFFQLFSKSFSTRLLLDLLLTVTLRDSLISIPSNLFSVNTFFQNFFNLFIFTCFPPFLFILLSISRTRFLLTCYLLPYILSSSSQIRLFFL